MFSAIDNLGEETLNQIATLALSSQLDEAEKLEVQVKTDPGQLLQGQLEFLTIQGEGLVMQQDLRMQAMEIELNRLAIDPPQLLGGNIELTQPLEGVARILVTEADLNRAFNSELLGSQMQNLQLTVDNQPVTIDIRKINCHLLDTGAITIDATVWFQHTAESRPVAFTATPCPRQDGRGVVLEGVQYDPEKALPTEITEALLTKAREILSLSNFEMDGISLRIQHLEVGAGTLTFQAAADVTHFPSAA